jgi:ankyrin repeat protein
MAFEMSIEDVLELLQAEEIDKLIDCINNKKFDFDLQFEENSNHTLLMAFCRIEEDQDDEDRIMTRRIAEALILNGAKLELKNDSGETALFFAVNDGNYEITELLLKHGAKIDNLVAIEENLLSKLYDANAIKIVKLLIEYGIDINTPGETKATFFQDIFFEHDDIEFANYLLDNGLDVRKELETIIDNGYLYMFIDRMIEDEEHKECLNKFLDLGVKSNPEDLSFLNDFLDHAIQYNEVGLAEICINNGVDVNKEDDFGSTPFINSLLTGNGEIGIKMIESGSHISLIEENQELQQAVEKKDYDSVKSIVEKIGMEKMNSLFGEPKTITDILRYGIQFDYDNIKTKICINDVVVIENMSTNSSSTGVILNPFMKKGKNKIDILIEACDSDKKADFSLNVFEQDLNTRESNDIFYMDSEESMPFKHTFEFENDDFPELMKWSAEKIAEIDQNITDETTKLINETIKAYYNKDLDFLTSAFNVQVHDGSSSLGFSPEEAMEDLIGSINSFEGDKESIPVVLSDDLKIELIGDNKILNVTRKDSNDVVDAENFTISDFKIASFDGCLKFV